MKYALVIMVLGLSVLGVLMGLYVPFIASYGGGWADTRGGTGGGSLLGQSSYSFFPQVNHYVLVIVVYACSLLLTFALMLYAYRQQHYGRFLKAFTFFSALPFIWAIIVHVIGFNYEKCFAPSASTACENPTQLIINRLLFHLGMIVLAIGSGWLLARMWSGPREQ